jgi:hypothetical protein
VKNARAAGRVTLRRGIHEETVEVEEVGAEEAAPVLRAYLWENGITRKFFDVTVESSDEDVVREAARHPVFRI